MVGFLGVRFGGGGQVKSSPLSKTYKDYAKN